MYVVRDKKTGRTLAISKAPLSEKLKAKDVFPRFDSKTMELLKTDLDALPAHFSVDATGKVKPQTAAEAAKAGKIKLPAHKHVKGGKIVDKPVGQLHKEGLLRLNEPFEYLTPAGEIKRYTNAQLVAKKLLTTDAHIDTVIAAINRKTAGLIEQSYPPRTEIRITKDFALWMYEGRPKNDARETAMLEMEAHIQKVRTDAAALKEKAETLRPGKPAKKKKAPAAEKPKEAPKPAATADAGETPDEYWTVEAIRNWMTDRNIEYVNRDRKPELLEKIKAALA